MNIIAFNSKNYSLEYNSSQITLFFYIILVIILATGCNKYSYIIYILIKNISLS